MKDAENTRLGHFEACRRNEIVFLAAAYEQKKALKIKIAIWQAYLFSNVKYHILILVFLGEKKCRRILMRLTIFKRHLSSFFHHINQGSNMSHMSSIFHDYIVILRQKEI